MRETRNAVSSILNSYSKHEQGKQLRELSELLDQYPSILTLIAEDLREPGCVKTGAKGLSVESVFRCLLLKQHLQVSYRRLAFHLSDSPTYRSFTRLQMGQNPSHSTLQGCIRRIKPETIQKLNQLLVLDWMNEGILNIHSLRIDSTVTESHIASPSDSQLLNDGIRVLSRLMSQSKQRTGVKHRFKDQRKRAKSLSFSIFMAKKAEKEALYPKLIACVSVTLKQVKKAIEKVRQEAGNSIGAVAWIQQVEHYQSLLLRVVDQTQRRVFNDEKVPAAEKIVSLFEPHTDIIVKGKRDTLYGHKINLATQEDGFVTYMNIEDGNPCDSALYLPVLDAHKDHYAMVPSEMVADGCYASQANVATARSSGVKRSVFNKPVGLGYHQMGVKKKTFDRLKNFRAGVEGNISELKRALGMGRVNWKGLDGFKACVWSSVLSYNLIRMIRLTSS